MNEYDEDSVQRVHINDMSISENLMNFVYFFDSGIQLVAFLTNLLLLLGLHSYSAFHDHMNIICRHLCAVFMLISAFGFMRTVFVIYDWRSSADLKLENVKEEDCIMNTGIPHITCVLLCAFSLILVVERSYATQNCRSYEYDNWSNGIKAICTFMWLPFPFVLICNAAKIFRNGNNYVDCEMRALEQNMLQRNAWFIIIASFNVIFALVFRCLITSNKEYEKDYLKNNYSTISIRFQTRENMNTCTFLSRVHAVMALLFFLPVCVDLYCFDSEDVFLTKMWKRELWQIFQPSLCLFFPLFFVKTHKRLYEKFLKLLDRRHEKEPCLAV